MCWRILKYLQHLFYRHYRWGHHIHSPYVFDFVSGVLYSKGSGGRKARRRGLEGRVEAWAGRGEVEQLPASAGTSSILRGMRGKRVVLVDAPYHDRASMKTWKELVKDPHVRVSIDAFYTGILLLREDLHKAHFRLNI